MNRPEEILHRALVAHLRARLPKPWMVFHVPNGGGRSKAEAGILKAMGVLAGMPDLLVVGPDVVNSITKQAYPDYDPLWDSLSPGRVTLIAIEVKAPPKRLASGKVSKAKPRVSEDQQAIIAQLGACGVPTLIATDLDQTLAALARLGVPLKGRQP